jgi:outer membrane protein assembly factor BamB
VVRGILGIDVDAAGNSLLTFVPSEASCGEALAPCIRKLGPDGTTLWTRPAAGNDDYLVPPRARFDANGRAITAWAYGDGLMAQTYDSDGTLVESFQIFEGEPYLSIDLAVDPQGNLLVVGSLGDSPSLAWATRVTPTGDVLWSATYDDLGPGEVGALVSGAAITDDGRAYLVGASQIIDIGLLELEGIAWVAEIEL